MKRRFGNLAVFVALIAFAIMAASVAEGAPVLRVRQIQSPLFAVPVIARQGAGFAISLKVDKDAGFVSAWLESPDEPGARIKLETAAPVDAGSGLSTVGATVPASAPEGLYDLAVEFNNERWDRQPHAVDVIKEYKQDFDFIQMTDIHFNVQFANMPGVDMNLLRRYVMREISAQKPEFVIFTGDLGLDPDTLDEDYVYHWQELTRWMRAPMFMVPGNHEQYYQNIDGHDIDGAEYWAAAYGPSHHSFDYGKMHFVGMNTFEFPRHFRDRRDKDSAFSGTLVNANIAPAQWDWLKADLAASTARGQYCVAYTHIPIEMLMGGNRSIGLPPNQIKLPGPTTKQFTDLLNSSNCGYIFVGHMHVNREADFGALHEVLTYSAGIDNMGRDDVWGYRVIHVRGGKITGTELKEIRLKDLK